MGIGRPARVGGWVCVPVYGLLCVAGSAVWAQQTEPIGSVGIADATVAGALEVSNGRAMLVGASTVTARERTAEIALTRGGAVRVCSTSGLHVTAGKKGSVGAGQAPLLLALDRGAIEIAAPVTASDVVMTPDLRFTIRSAGSLDLRMRVARNGDTCVENRGATAPLLGVTDLFGEASYEIKPGQHLLFEHGSLKEVVDHESEPCGCPPVPVVSVADAGVAAAPGAAVAAPSTATAASAAARTAADQHPFPAAESAGLAPVSAPPQAPAGQVHAQVSTSMSYGEGAGTVGPADGTGSAAGAAPAGATEGGSSSPAATNAAVASPGKEAEAQGRQAGTAQAPPPPPAPGSDGVFHTIGRFFKKLFGGK